MDATETLTVEPNPGESRTDAPLIVTLAIGDDRIRIEYWRELYRAPGGLTFLDEDPFVNISFGMESVDVLVSSRAINGPKMGLITREGAIRVPVEVAQRIVSLDPRNARFDWLIVEEQDETQARSASTVPSLAVQTTHYERGWFLPMEMPIDLPDREGLWTVRFTWETEAIYERM